MIQIKRAYDEVSPTDGERVLVDRLWPRGVSKERIQIAFWAKDVAPSAALRRWFGHDPAKWTEFRMRYEAELKVNPAAWTPILEAARTGDVTLVYGAKDEIHNDAVVLQAFLQDQLDTDRQGA